MVIRTGSSGWPDYDICGTAGIEIPGHIELKSTCHFRCVSESWHKFDFRILRWDPPHVITVERSKVAHRRTLMNILAAIQNDSTDLLRHHIVDVVRQLGRQCRSHSR